VTDGVDSSLKQRRLVAAAEAAVALKQNVDLLAEWTTLTVPRRQKDAEQVRALRARQRALPGSSEE
jgi:hypothetical protein